MLPEEDERAGDRLCVCKDYWLTLAGVEFPAWCGNSQPSSWPVCLCSPSAAVTPNPQSMETFPTYGLLVARACWEPLWTVVSSGDLGALPLAGGTLGQCRGCELLARLSPPCSPGLKCLCPWLSCRISMGCRGSESTWGGSSRS